MCVCVCVCVCLNMSTILYVQIDKYHWEFTWDIFRKLFKDNEGVISLHLPLKRFFFPIFRLHEMIFMKDYQVDELIDILPEKKRKLFFSS